MKRFMSEFWTGRETKILFGTGFAFLLAAWVTVWFPEIKQNIPEQAYTWISYIGIVFSIIVCCLYWRRMDNDIDNNKIGDNFYPTLMVAQGTFYTFIGISVILITFGDDSTIRELLAGLRLAFITSVIGLIFSIAAKMYIKKRITEIQEDSVQKEIPVYVDDEQMFYALLDIKKAIEGQNERFFEIQNDYLKQSQKELSIQTNNLINGVNAYIQKHNEEYMRAIKVTNQAYLVALNELSTRIQNQIIAYSDSLTNLHVQFETTGKQIITEVQTNNKIHTDSITVMKTNIREYVELTTMQLKEMIDFLESTKNAMQNIERSIARLDNSYKHNAEMLGQFSQKIDEMKVKELSDAVTVFAGEINKTVSGMHHSADALTQIVPEIQSVLSVARDMNEQAEFINTRKEDLTNIMNSMVKRFELITNKMMIGLNDASGKVIEKWENIGDTYWENFEEQFNIVYKAMNDQVIYTFRTAGEKFEETVKDTNQKIEELNQNSEETKLMLKSVNDNANDIKELIRVIGELRQSVEAFHQASAMTNQLHNEENNKIW